MIDRYDAPEGFVAVRDVIGTCSNCSYKYKCREPKCCLSNSRKYGESVIFFKKEDVKRHFQRVVS